MVIRNKIHKQYQRLHPLSNLILTLVGVHKELLQNLTMSTYILHFFLSETRVCVYFSCLSHEFERHMYRHMGTTTSRYVKCIYKYIFANYKIIVIRGLFGLFSKLPLQPPRTWQPGMALFKILEISLQTNQTDRSRYMRIKEVTYIHSQQPLSNQFFFDLFYLLLLLFLFSSSFI